MIRGFFSYYGMVLRGAAAHAKEHILMESIGVFVTIGAAWALHGSLTVAFGTGLAALLLIYFVFVVREPWRLHERYAHLDGKNASTDRLFVLLDRTRQAVKDCRRSVETTPGWPQSRTHYDVPPVDEILQIVAQFHELCASHGRATITTDIPLAETVRLDLEMTKADVHDQYQFVRWLMESIADRLDHLYRDLSARDAPA